MKTKGKVVRRTIMEETFEEDRYVAAVVDLGLGHGPLGACGYDSAGCPNNQTSAHTSMVLDTSLDCNKRVCHHTTVHGQDVGAIMDVRTLLGHQNDSS